MLIISVMALSGCSNGETIGVNVYSGGSRVVPNVSSGGVIPYEHGSNVASVGSQSEKQTIPYILDPENTCTITVSDNTITVSGKRGDVLTGVMEGNPDMRKTKSELGDELVFTLTPKNNDFKDKYGIFYVIDANNFKNKIYIELSENGVSFPDVSALVKSNAAAVSSPETLSEDAVAKYITRDGSREKIADILGEIKEISDGICKGLDSDYEKLRAIVRWSAENIYYDHPAHNKGIPSECLSLEYMLNNKSSVCGGYSNITSALCEAQGIRCYNIKGRGITKGGCFLQNLQGDYHEWNIAEIDGRHIIIDTGWSSTNHFREDGTFSRGAFCYGYFDISPEVFALDHKAQSAEYRDYFALLEE